jgi:hypothetical protein
VRLYILARADSLACHASQANSCLSNQYGAVSLVRQQAAST